MVHEELLKILVCPETKQPVRLANSEVVDKINQSILAGSVKTVSGAAVSDSITGLLVREDGKRAYIIRDDIPIMLAEEAISLDS